MNDAVITLKTDFELKQRAMKLADELGFSLSAIINAYLKSFLRTKTVNFTTLDESKPTKYMIDSLKESRADIKAGRVVSFNTSEEEIEYLNRLIKADEDNILKKVSKAATKVTPKYKETISRPTSSVYAQSI